MHSVVSGKAPAGARLRLEKSFATVTSPVVSATGTTGEPLAFEGRLTSTLQVPAVGRYTWHVNPSNWGASSFGVSTSCTAGEAATRTTAWTPKGVAPVTEPLGR